LKSIEACYHTSKFWISTTLLSLILGSAVLLIASFDRSGNLAHRISSLWSRLVCRLNGIKVDIIGMENVLPDRAQIFVANHQGYFDIFSLSGFLPVQIRWVAKSILFWIPFVGWSMKAAGYIPVDRTNRKKSYQSFLQTIGKLKSGCSVVLFPEGTRSVDGTIGPFKKGGHLLAVRSGAPMVPITILGTGKIIKKGSGIIRPGPIRIVISPPVQIDSNPSRNTEEALQRIRQTIVETYEENLPQLEKP
jgi:1-acyl-sn-glycerol-3-phosphate acyltransferase